jgi:hypothetical protein
VTTIRSMKATKLPPGRYFISHSYHDEVARERLIALLPRTVEAVVFPPIRVEPDEFVSTPLIEAIRSCDGLITLKSQHSDKSFWVAFEREFAVRAGLTAYIWDSITSLFTQDSAEATELVVVVNYHPDDLAIIEDDVIALMRRRSFDVLQIVSGPGHDMGKIFDTSMRGGYIITFQSRNAATSRQVSSVVSFALEYVGTRIVMASIDGTSARPEEYPFWMPFVQLWDGSGISPNRIDDLIVLLCFLMYNDQQRRRQR